MTTYRLQFTQERGSPPVLDPLGWMHVRAGTMLAAAKTALHQALRRADTDALALVESGDFRGWVPARFDLSGRRGVLRWHTLWETPRAFSAHPTWKPPRGNHSPLPLIRL
jgi:hypothetical protein